MRRYIPFILLILLVACAGGSAKPKGVVLDSPFAGGTAGLSLEFSELRKDVFDGAGDPFDIIVKLENKGETLVSKENVLVKLSGFNPTEFDKTEAQLSLNAPDDVIELRKDPQGNLLAPPSTFVEFTALNHKGLITGATAQFTVRANACYLYRTKAVSKLCIREDLLTPEAGGICEINQDKQVHNSGAPVQFATFKENTRAKDRVGFTVEVQNSGTGGVFERNSKCNKDDRQKEGRVYVVVNTGLSGVQCTGLESTANGAEGFVTLRSGTNTLSCTQQVNTNTDFEQLVNLEAIYDYEQMIQSSFAVKSSGE